WNGLLVVPPALPAGCAHKAPCSPLSAPQTCERPATLPEYFRGGSGPFCRFWAAPSAVRVPANGDPARCPDQYRAGNQPEHHQRSPPKALISARAACESLTLVRSTNRAAIATTSASVSIRVGTNALSSASLALPVSMISPSRATRAAPPSMAVTSARRSNAPPGSATTRMLRPLAGSVPTNLGWLESRSMAALHSLSSPRADPCPVALGRSCFPATLSFAHSAQCAHCASQSAGRTVCTDD